MTTHPGLGLPYTKADQSSPSDPEADPTLDWKSDSMSDLWRGWPIQSRHVCRNVLDLGR